MMPNLEVAIQPNHIAARNLDSGRSAAMEAPFSCGHLIADDIDILEHASYRLFRKIVIGSPWSFPRVKVSIPGRLVHSVERRIIQDALLNAGASRVTFDATADICDEQKIARNAYVENAKRKG